MRKRLYVLAVVVVALLSLCASSRKISDSQFIALCKAGNTQGVISAIKSGANINAKDKDSITPLIWAAGKGYAGIVNALIKAGADIEARDCEENTALHWAAADRKTDIIKILLKARADVNARDELGTTPLFKTAGEGGTYAAGKSGTEAARILLKAGADVSASTPGGYTALHNAAVLGDTEMVKLLLDAGANAIINAKCNDEGYTALMLAASEGHADTVKILLKAKADVNAMNNDGETALIYVIRYPKDNPQYKIIIPEIVNALLDYGANVNVKDKDGKNALDYARENSALKGTTALRRLEKLTR